MANAKVPQQAQPKPGGSPEGDAAGAMHGGEAQRGDPSAAPRPLGRKDPTTTGEAAPDKENVRIRD